MAGSLFATIRAVDGDDHWVMRLQAACVLLNVTYTRDLAVRVSFALSEYIHCDELGVVSTVNVPDNLVLETVAELGLAATLESDMLPNVLTAPAELPAATLPPSVGVGGES